MKTSLALACLLITSLAQAQVQTTHPCSAAALKQAEQLLAFSYGPDERIAIDKSVKLLAPIKNPANKSQSFDVLEVWGNIYKGQYRMHLIYAQMKGECLLMGQEILAFSNL